MQTRGRRIIPWCRPAPLSHVRGGVHRGEDRACWVTAAAGLGLAEQLQLPEEVADKGAAAHDLGMAAWYRWAW